MSSVTRGPGKRKLKQSDVVVTIDDLGDSSDDSDFNIEEHCNDNESDSEEDSDDTDVSKDTHADTSGDSPDVSPDVTPTTSTNSNTNNIIQPQVNQVTEEIMEETSISTKVKKLKICYVCLGSKSDAQNEIVECDSCGATVHEGCYGVQDSWSEVTSVSSSSSEAWFCEPCRAGEINPPCELCPNFGGILKETDTARWVHLVCALYIPGVAFTEADKLTGVTLSEIPHTKWGSEICSYCPDFRFNRTGVTIQCDTGLCRVYFHVTCGQMEGLLVESTAEELEAADPYYAQCKLHSDSDIMKRRKRDWERLEVKRERINELKETNAYTIDSEVQRKLEICQEEFKKMRLARPPPFVPKNKVPRSLTTSATAVRLLWQKSESMGIDMVSIANKEILIESIVNVSKRWHVEPAFSIEFVAFYTERKHRIVRMREEKLELESVKNAMAMQIRSQQQNDGEIEKICASEVKVCCDLVDFIKDFHLLLTLMKNKNVELVDVNEVAKITSTTEGNATSQKCSICEDSSDPHLMTICDKCGGRYHLSCLDPPLTRMPKKTKLLGWQCSECDKNDDADGPSVEVDLEEPRKLRNEATDDDSATFATTPGCSTSMMASGESSSSFMAPTISTMETTEDRVEVLDVPNEQLKETPRKSSKKRRREKHRDRYSPELIPHGKHHGRKKKHKSSHSQSSSLETTSTKHKRTKKHKSVRQKDSEPTVEEMPSTEPKQPIKLVIKTIPNPNGEGKHHPQLFVATESTGFSSSIPSTSYMTSTPVQQKTKKSPPIERCSTCRTNDEISLMVKCDECFKYFHFGCLDPPVRKSPKVRGYSWHCADCDPTDSDTC